MDAGKPETKQKRELSVAFQISSNVLLAEVFEIQKCQCVRVMTLASFDLLLINSR